VKRFGRDEPIWGVIYICIETTKGITLCSYPYFKLAKTPVFLIIVHVFSSTKSKKKRVEQVLPTGSGGGGGSPNNVYTCK
jgi:hypothetical protein